MKYSTAAEGATTLLEALERSRDTAVRHPPGEVPPVAILWTDADGEWLPLISVLRERWPGLLTLGTFDPAKRQGPAIWLRCVVERALPKPALPEGVTPVVYLPHIPRTALRAGDDCPEAVRPLVELQYRGVAWCQRNGRDWTVEAMLVSEDVGLELEIARDERTHKALLGSLGQLAVTPVARLRGRRLEAADFDKLMIEDTPRELLTWLSAPDATRKRWDEEDLAKWSAFCSRCRAEYYFDPEREGAVLAGEKLGLCQGTWEAVWNRFAEAPAIYDGIPALLRRAKPATLIFDKETWPDENEAAETSLRGELLSLAALAPATARVRIAELEDQHGLRRKWVWARMGESPLALALECLAILARQTNQSLGGDTLNTMASHYAETGWRTDDAVWRSLAAVKTTEDCQAVEAAVRTLYLPWLDDAARHFQKLAAATPLPVSRDSAPPDVKSGGCLLFADGLRFDLGQRLSARAEESGLRVAAGRRWAAAPTVTATAKPAVTPAASKIKGHRLGEGFEPDVASTGLPATTERLRKIIESEGYQVLGSTEVGKPSPTAHAWAEYGELDRLGHALQGKLPAQLDAQLDLLLERIRALLDAGWKQVQVVTDHGWLLLPGGLPSVKLAQYLVGSRWARCATIKETSQVDLPMAAWFWNPAESFAFGPGVSCFGAGNAYTHGGLSLQECLIPALEFTLAQVGETAATTIAEVTWSGLRCRVSLNSAATGTLVDLRTKATASDTSITTIKPVGADGRTSLVVADDSFEGTIVSVVVLDPSGRVITKQATTVGGDH